MKSTLRGTPGRRAVRWKGTNMGTQFTSRRRCSPWGLPHNMYSEEMMAELTRCCPEEHPSFPEGHPEAPALLHTTGRSSQPDYAHMRRALNRVHRWLAEKPEPVDTRETWTTLLPVITSTTPTEDTRRSRAHLKHS